ncbi:MAG TPA: nucleoside deaminase [Burkholderiales bacterium]|nr:nucleoside deaminase [Burkholderiales bacterium]
MRLALERARGAYASGGRPIHCLIVQQDGRIVGEAGNTVARDTDPSAHAEVNAIRRACANLRTIDLSGCSLYTPMEPCPMCLSTILEAKISRLVVGARHRRVGRTDLGDYSVESLLATLSRHIEIASVREAECEELRIAWKRSRGEA